MARTCPIEKTHPQRRLREKCRGAPERQRHPPCVAGVVSKRQTTNARQSCAHHAMSAAATPPNKSIEVMPLADETKLAHARRVRTKPKSPCGFSKKVPARKASHQHTYARQMHKSRTQTTTNIVAQDRQRSPTGRFDSHRLDACCRLTVTLLPQHVHRPSP